LNKTYNKTVSIRPNDREFPPFEKVLAFLRISE